MHSHDLRLVAVRVIDRFKNMGYQIKVQAVHYMDDVPVGYCDPWQSSYIMSPSLSHLGADVPEKLVNYHIEQLELAKTRAIRDIDIKIEACRKPMLIFPDDFENGENTLAAIGQKVEV